MRLPQWSLTAWVLLSLAGALIGGLLAYNGARERTRELNDIAPLEEGVDIVRIGELLLGLREPEAPNVDNGEEPVAMITAQPVMRITNTPALDNSVQAEATETPVPETPVATDAPVAEPSPDATVAPETPAEAAPGIWSDPRRVNILLLGIDQRQGEEGPFNTDTMILLSIDPAGRTGALLSIPRDLWVAYPAGLGDGKINSANRIGDLREYPGGGGPALAKETVSALLGLRVHYFVMVNFDAFLTFIDVIGEVEVCPPEAIDDPKYPDGSYGYKPIYIEAGCQMMSGERLLEYSRTRATTNGDFDRAQRQQEVIFAVQQKILSTGGVSRLVRNAETLWDSIKVNIRTDLSLQEIIELGLLAETISRDNIRNAAIGPGEVEFGLSPQGEDILIPITSDILLLIEDLFRPAGTPPTYLPE